MSTSHPPPVEGSAKQSRRKLPIKVLSGIAILLVAIVAGVFISGPQALSSSHYSGTPASVTTITNVQNNSEPTAIGSSYLATGASFVDFIQLNNSNGSLSGSAEVISTTGRSPNKTTTNSTLQVLGTVHGSTISLSFDGAALTFGTVQGSSIVLNIPQPDGELASITFQQADAAEFNAATAQLQGSIVSDNQAAKRSQALQTEQSDVANEASAISSLISGNGYGGFQQQEQSLAADVASVTKSLTSETSDLTTTSGAEQQVIAEAGQSGISSGQVCGDAAAVSGDAAAVSGDAAGVSGYVSIVEADIQALRTSVTDIQNSFAQFQSNMAALPSYRLTGAPTQNAVTQAINAANGDITAALSTTNNDIDQANNGVAMAYNDSSNAFQAGGCGPAPSPPAPLSHIS